MSNPDTSGPISVPESAVGDQFASAFRALLISIGSYGAGKGWFDASIAATAIPVLMIALPVLWSQLKVRSQHADLVTVAQAAPNDVATVGK